MKNQTVQPNNSDAKKLIKYFQDLFYQKFGVKPAVPYAQCIATINRLLKEHDYATLEGVVLLYFEHEKDKVFHLPSILSAWAINKYIPMLAKKSDPRLYVK